MLAGGFEDRIKCTLRRAGLSERPRPKYETISYCWGDANDQASIEINTSTLSVPASSAAAIRRVRFPNENRLIWIDAVCINQEDLVERAQQVSMMGDIYSSSAVNIVYLGEEGPTTGMALQSIDSVMGEIRRETQDFRNVDGTPFDVRNPHITTLAPILCEVDPPALDVFYNLPWFRSAIPHYSWAISAEC